MVTTAIVCLFQAQSALADQVRVICALQYSPVYEKECESSNLQFRKFEIKFRTADVFLYK